ncbi:MAG TPA: hypothetical protein VG839_00345 [Asticcacaulis sp.]|nr:hypothetical protein [Asticcacaulis sp.]
MYFLLNDLVLDIEPSRMMQPLDQERFAALSFDYIAQLGKEMFADDASIHRKNPERARRLCYLITLKMPRVNAAQFFIMAPGAGPAGIDTDFRTLADYELSDMHQQQVLGRLNYDIVDQAVWHRLAA